MRTFPDFTPFGSKIKVCQSIFQNSFALRAPFHLKADELFNFINISRMATPTSWILSPMYMYQHIRATSHGVVLKLVNPAINYYFYINRKNDRDCCNWPCKSTQEPCKNIVRVLIVSLVHTLGFPYATAPCTHPDG